MYNWEPAQCVQTVASYRVTLTAFNGEQKVVGVIAGNAQDAEEWALMQNPRFIQAEAI